MSRKRWSWRDALPEIEEMAGLGFSRKHICEALGINRTTWYNYAAKNKEIEGTYERARQQHHKFLADLLKEQHIKKELSLKALMFALRAQYNYRDHGPIQAEVDQAPVEPIIFEEVVRNDEDEDKD